MVSAKAGSRSSATTTISARPTSAIRPRVACSPTTPRPAMTATSARSERCAKMVSAEVGSRLPATTTTPAPATRVTRPRVACSFLLLDWRAMTAMAARPAISVRWLEFALEGPRSHATTTTPAPLTSATPSWGVASTPRSRAWDVMTEILVPSATSAQ